MGLGVAAGGGYRHTVLSDKGPVGFMGEVAAIAIPFCVGKSGEMVPSEAL